MDDWGQPLNWIHLRQSFYFFYLQAILNDSSDIGVSMVGLKVVYEVKSVYLSFMWPGSLEATVMFADQAKLYAIEAIKVNGV